jgi:hypothetical protein
MPEIYFQLAWIVSMTGEKCDPRQQRLADEEFAPRFYQHWIDGSGKPVTDKEKREWLAAPYSKQLRRATSGFQYQDVRIRHDSWSQLENYYPKSQWTSMIKKVGEAAFDQVLGEMPQHEWTEKVIPNCRLEAISAVVVIGSEG